MKRLVLSLTTVLLTAVLLVQGAGAAEFDKYALESTSASLSTSQAGAHPDFTATFRLTSESGNPYALTRDIKVKLPPGLFGNPQAFPTCASLQLGTTPEDSKCPPDSQVGVTEVTLGGRQAGTFVDPIYNMSAPGGDVVARFGFFAAIYPGIINVRLDPTDDSLLAAVESAPGAAELLGANTTFWGVPASPSHDFQRMTVAEAAAGTSPPNRKSSLPETPFMTNPTSCGLQREVGFTLTSYPLPEAPTSLSASFPQITGCGSVGFHPQVAVKPTTEEATTGSGLDYELDLPTEGLEFSNLLYDSETKRAEVVLPEGMTVNPSEAEGLGVCTEADLARETYNSPPNTGCPETSKIGTVTAISPAIDRAAEGSLYIAAPYQNRFDSLLALYMVIKIPDRGVLVKIAGKVTPDPVTGRLTTVFDEIPPLPVASFRLHFREGARAPLVTPPTCGIYDTVSNFEPWSMPGGSVLRETPFAITSGVDHGACPSGGTPPLTPGFVAGTVDNAAAHYSPFYLRIERKDNEQEITGFATKLAPGITGNLTNIPFCGESEIQHAREQTGAEAETSPACPVASQIGHTIAEAGVGSVLAQTQGGLYFAGPFAGAPFSVVSITSAKVGPFDLGTVVVRLPLQIDPLTAQVNIPSGPADQIPHIIKGIVIHLRSIRAYIDRDKFMLNPTSCEPMSISANVIGSGADFASATDDVTAGVTDRYQGADCSNLAFKPTFKVSTSGKTSRQKGASLQVKLTYPKAPQGTQANIRSVKVSLPKQLPSRLTTLQHACTDAQFTANPAACPAGSRVGQATAVTPILPVAITGPAYFVSHGGAKFPELVLVLQGYGITIELHGETFISKAGVTSSTFHAVPDQPVTSFQLTLPQGKNSALAANGNLCRAKLKMPTTFTAQNGAVVKQNTPITTTGCPKHKIKKAKKRARHTRA